MDFFVVHQNFADVRTEIVADGADEQRAFHEKQVGFAMGFARFFDGAPKFQQVVEIPLQFFHAAADAGSAGNQAHAGGDIQLGHRVFQLLPILAFDTAGHAAAARVVRHQYQVASGQADEGGQCRAFVAAFVFFHLDDDLHAFFEHFLNAGAAAFIVLEIGAGYFFKRQKAVPVGSVIDKTRLQRRLDAGDDTFVDIAFALFFAQRFNVEVEQVLPVHNGHAQFFCLRGVKQHTFHDNLSGGRRPFRRPRTPR